MPSFRLTDGASGVTFGWYALQWPREMRATLQEMLRRAGRDPSKCEPPAMGEILVRISWGHEAQPASILPAQRPALRRRGGTLRVKVIRAKGIPARGGLHVKVVRILILFVSFVCGLFSPPLVADSS